MGENEASENGQNTPIDYAVLDEFANRGNLFFGLDLSRISHLLIYQVHHLHLDRKAHTFQITDEIKSLELGHPASFTKHAEKFTKPPLVGLWKKHFPQPQFILRNINIHNKANLFSDEIDPIVKQEIARGKSAEEISHSLTFEAFERRALSRKITGEWIIYCKHNKQNYYLTLATHTERDEDIYERINLGCQPEFPFLSIFTK